MLDIRWIVNNPDKFKLNMQKKNCFNQKQMDDLILLYKTKKNTHENIQNLQKSRNENSELVRINKDQEQKNNLINKVKAINSEISSLEIELSSTESELEKLLSCIPNILQEDVPVGEDEHSNVEVSKFETKNHVVNTANKPLLDHSDILQKFGLIETEKTVKMSGSRFVTLVGSSAKLERALVNFMMDQNIEAGFKEYSPPYLVKESAMYNAGHLPKFDEDSFATTSKERLIPTAEVPLVNLFADEVVNIKDLPIRMTAHTPCFRSEAGSAGRDTKGMIRLHQFSKVELVTICEASKSQEEHELIVNQAQKLLKLLDLPFRVMLLCSGDTGLWSSKTYDLEVWFPSQNKYREISSCSNCTDYQARRLLTRHKSLDGSGSNILVHTLNGSSLPIGRTIAAILENYINYDEDFIKIPEVLIPYFGKDKITL